MNTQVMEDRGEQSKLHQSCIAFSFRCLCVFNFSLAMSLSVKDYGILKAFGGFCIPIKIGIPFCLIDLGTLAFKCAS